jgi:pantoate--beta-alanine ligase
MRVISTVNGLQKAVKEISLSPLGFVPTMGALHNGHMSLVSNAVSLCPLVTVSIYVNPTQFNDKNDLKNYPRTLDNDLAMLEESLREKDIVFTPDDKEIYPHEDKRVFHFGNLDKVMEAKCRPGHFNGVAQVVTRLFDIVRPQFAFFGEKDFQQLAVIKELVRQTGSNIKIIGNPIVREEDGLAMSSRNRMLEPAIREKAGIIFATISKASQMIHEYDIKDIIDFVNNNIEKTAGFKVEYFNIVDDVELIPVNSKTEIRPDRKYYGCIAVKAGMIRLLDNIEIPL